MESWVKGSSSRPLVVVVVVLVMALLLVGMVIGVELSIRLVGKWGREKLVLLAMDAVRWPRGL